MKKAVFLVALFLFSAMVLSVPAFAEDGNLYENSYRLIDDGRLSEIIKDNENDFFKENGIDIKDYGWVNKITAKNSIKEILSIVKEKIRTPIKALLSIVSIILISSAVSTFESKGEIYKTLLLFSALVVSVIIAADIWNLISNAVNGIRHISSFMLSFIPIFISALVLSGKAASGTASGGLLLLISQAVNLFASDFIMPIMGGYLSIGIMSTVTPFDFAEQVGEFIKKAATFLLTAIFTVFVGIMGIQTSVNSAADTLGVKTAKFLVGTCVPIGGGALSEATNMLYGSMSLVKSSVGIYGVVIIVLTALPFIIEVALWRGALIISSLIAKSFNQKEISMLLISVDSVLSVLFSILLFASGIMVFSLAISISMGG